MHTIFSTENLKRQDLLGVCLSRQVNNKLLLPSSYRRYTTTSTTEIKPGTTTQAKIVSNTTLMTDFVKENIE
jgi:hypothetical protein